MMVTTATQHSSWQPIDEVAFPRRRHRTLPRPQPCQWEYPASEQCACASTAGSYLGLIHIAFSAMLASPDVTLAGACAMPSQTNERGIVHVVDDDASIRGALEGLFESVGLDTQTYAAPREFLATNVADRPGCIVIDIR